jgi:hypothetical protein
MPGIVAAWAGTVEAFSIELQQFRSAIHGR